MHFLLSCIFFLGNHEVDLKAKEMIGFQRHSFPAKPYTPSTQSHMASTTTATATKETQIFNFKTRTFENEHKGGSSNPYAYEGAGISADLVKSVFSKKSTSGPSIMNWKRNITVAPTYGKENLCDIHTLQFC